MKTPKNFRLVAAALVSGILVASSGCSVDSLDQTTAPQPMSGSGLTTFSDISQVGTHSVSIDPSVANTLVMAGSKLEIPAGAICALGTSGYGPTFWDAPCEPESGPVQLTVTINPADTLGASIDFEPALRFSPLTQVMLTLSAPAVTKKDVKDWIILYCPTPTSTTNGNGSGGNGGGKDDNKCVNESLNDKDLQTFVDYDLEQLFRRIKHFSRYSVSRSGYLLAE